MHRIDRFPRAFVVPTVLSILAAGPVGMMGQQALGGQAVKESSRQEAARIGDKNTSRPSGQGLDLGVDFFPILPWDPQHGWRQPYLDRKQGLAGIAECQFTLAGFVQPRDLPECEKLGLAAIMAPPNEEDSWSGPWRNLSDEQIDRRVKAMVDQGGGSKAVVGYFLTDEPGTPAFPALAKAVAAVRKYAPGKLAYINLLPGYATLGAPDASQLGAASFTEYLERFVNEVHPQILSYDNYMVQYSDDLADAKRSGRYYNDLLEVRRVALKYGLAFWNIVSSNQIRPTTTVPSPANLLLQAYTTLAAGGRGVSWYTYYASSSSKPGYAYAPIDASQNKTNTWSYLQMVNRQVRTIGPMMNRLQSTGVFFTSPAPVESPPLLPGRVVKDIDSRASLQQPMPVRPPIMVGEFIDNEGGDWVMMVNLSLERSAHITFHTHNEDKKPQIVSATDGRLMPFDPVNGLWLAAGQGALIQLQSP